MNHPALACALSAFHPPSHALSLQLRSLSQS